MIKIKVLIADDHQLFRDGLKQLLLNAPEIEVVGEASNGKEVLDFIDKIPVDVVLMDIEMPVLNGIEATKIMVKKFPQIPVLILSTHYQKIFIEHAIAIGVKGYLLKNCDFDVLITAIKTLARGAIFFDKPVSQIHQDNSQQLSEQELIIIKHIADGLSNKLIADALFLSTRTIEAYRANILKKLKLNNVAELIKYCYKNDIL